MTSIKYASTEQQTTAMLSISKTHYRHLLKAVHVTTKSVTLKMAMLEVQLNRLQQAMDIKRKNTV